jgi:hypothetical protein
MILIIDKVSISKQVKFIGSTRIELLGQFKQLNLNVGESQLEKAKSTPVYTRLVKHSSEISQKWSDLQTD